MVSWGRASGGVPSFQHYEEMDFRRMFIWRIQPAQVTTEPSSNKSASRINPSGLGPFSPSWQASRVKPTCSVIEMVVDRYQMPSPICQSTRPCNISLCSCPRANPKAAPSRYCISDPGSGLLSRDLAWVLQSRPKDRLCGHRRDRKRKLVLQEQGVTPSRSHAGPPQLR